MLYAMGGQKVSIDSVSWLCRADSDRQRLLDMEGRIKPLRTASMAILALALVAAGPWLGWWTLVPLVLSLGGFAAMDRGLQEAARPEYRLAGAWVLAEVVIAISVALTGGPHSPAVSWLVIPMVTLPARFSSRGVVAGVVLVAVLIIATTVGVDASLVVGHPTEVIFPLALLGAIAVLSIALMRSDLHHRGAAIIDPLTGMLNRKAMESRVAELTQQARIVGQPVGVIVGDLDCFKKVNDLHGHATGDAVLRDIAYRLRKRLRAFDLAYRLGGEEFLVLLPGAIVAEATKIAEELRCAVGMEPVAGLSITMSFGVSASRAGQFDYATVFAAADAALYEAKRAGRDQVRVLPPAGVGAAEHDPGAPARVVSHSEPAAPARA